MTYTYRARTFVPELARRAEALAAEQEFTLACRPEVGRLLHTLAATEQDGRIGELIVAPSLGRSSAVIVATHIGGHARG